MSTPTSLPILPALDDTLGAAFVGLIVAVLLYGVLCLQAYIYSQNTRDGLILKCLVGSVWLVDTFHVTLISHAVYYYVITNYFNPAALLITTWTVNIHVVINCFIAFMVQLFFAWRVFMISDKNYPLTGIIILFACVQLGFGWAMTVRAFRLENFQALTTVEWIVGTSLGSNLVCDLLITAGMCYYLQKKKQTGIKRTKSLLNTLLIYSLTTGLLTSVFSIINITTFLTMPTNFVNIGINFMLGKLYSNSLLATLNARQTVKENWGKNHTISLQQLPTPYSDGSNGHKGRGSPDYHRKYQISDGESATAFVSDEERVQSSSQV